MSAPLPLKQRTKERPWTPEQDAMLFALKASGLTMAAIGERLGRTPQAVMSRAYNLSVAARRAVPPRRDDLGERIEAYLARIADLNGYDVSDLKASCYGWTVA